MEKVIEELKNEFQKKDYKDKDSKLAYAIGYLENCEKVSRKEAIQIIWKIFNKEI